MLATNARFEYDQRQFCEPLFSQARTMAPILRRRHQATAGKNGIACANRELSKFIKRLRWQGNDTARQFDLRRFHFHAGADDQELRDFCEAKAKQCERMALTMKPEVLVKAYRDLLSGYGIELKGKCLLSRQGTARLSDAKWWRRKIRVLSGRTCEQICREIGLVRRGRGAYVSDFTLRRKLEQDNRNRHLLDNLEATNELGHSFSLSDLAALSVSNPVLRRGELMVRMRGFEEWVEAHKGETWRGMFYTWTCPSAYHVRRYSGKENPNYNGSTPSEASDYLNRLWQRARAAIQRARILFFGFRIAEPHHDGCPHWHMLLFVPRCRRKSLNTILRHYALSVDGNEPGARQHRFKAVVIDPRKGGPSGYLAKYVAKNIDGFAVGLDEEADDFAAITAARVRAWSSVWGIRQFQQIGGPPVTVYRELRRLTTLPERVPVEDSYPVRKTPEQLKLVMDAADQGNWKDFTEHMGGAVARRAARPIQAAYFIRNTLNHYGERIKWLAGIWTHWFAFPLRTHIHTWTIKCKHTLLGEAAKAAAFLRGPPAPATLDLCQ